MIERRFLDPTQGDVDTTLPDAAVALTSPIDGFFVANVGVINTVIVRPLSGQLIDGALLKSIAAGFALLFITDGAGWRSLGTSTAGAAHVIEDEGVPLTQRSSLNFQGGGVTALDSAGKTVVFIPSPPAAYDTVQDEGVPVTQRTVLNFVGAGVVATDSGGVTTITISGGGGGADLDAQLMAIMLGGQ